jgi:hypothetical protein
MAREATAAPCLKAASAVALKAASADRALLKIAALHAAGAVLAGAGAITHPAKRAPRALPGIGRSKLPRIGPLPSWQLPGPNALSSGRKLRPSHASCRELASAGPLSSRGRAGFSTSRPLRTARASLA